MASHRLDGVSLSASGKAKTPTMGEYPSNVATAAAAAQALLRVGLLFELLVLLLSCFGMDNGGIEDKTGPSLLLVVLLRRLRSMGDQELSHKVQAKA